VLFVQVEIVCAAVVVHSEAEQHAGAAMPMHVLPPGQVRWPVGHVPLQAVFCAMHVPLQFCGRLTGQLGRLSSAVSGCAGTSGARSAPRSGEVGESGVVSRGPIVSRTAGTSEVAGLSMVEPAMSTTDA